ncbi:hypothetical protein ACFQ3C_05005 [Seohaeicola saemankumensis]|uniref:Transferrin-binding protein B C-lobe/N-lobe beta barrel domain-containing protein n=1 Tax=Seohaeicola saemankumensis TaxID=481181 RepID=A0ABW3TBA5_9RHOB
MKFKVALMLPVLGLLSACGGGSTSVVPSASFTTLRAFSDGAGVGRGVASDGTETVFIAPDIAAVVAGANQSSGNEVVDVQFSDFSVVQTLPTAVVRSGTITVEGEVANVLIIEDNGGEAGLVYLEFPGYADAVFAVGSAYGAAPGGEFTYSGAHIVSNRIFGGAEVGDFTLTANFTNGTFSYNGSTTNTSLTGSGGIDVANGRFASGSLTSTVSGSTATASMYGQLHGDTAQSVSGVFHTNEANPTYAGAFVGSRP